MNELLTAEPVSTASAEFLTVVDEHLARGEVVVIVLRYAYCGGYGEHAFVRTRATFNELLRSLKQRTSVTAFFESAFAIRGVADEQLKRKTLEFVRIVATCRRDETVYAKIKDGPEGILNGEQMGTLRNQGDLNAWFVRNQNAAVLIGTMPWWKDNCDDFVTAYVPDSDGVVRPGAY